MLEVTEGVEAALRRAFANVASVERVMVFGSWATRPSPGDIDVVVVGSADAFDTIAAVQEVELVARVPVNAISITEKQWDDAEGSFVANIKAGPVVEMTLHRVVLPG